MYTAKYKCRRCAEEHSGCSVANMEIAHDAMMRACFEIGELIAMEPKMIDIHGCEDGGYGVSDFQGFHYKGNEKNVKSHITLTWENRPYAKDEVKELRNEKVWIENYGDALIECSMIWGRMHASTARMDTTLRLDTYGVMWRAWQDKPTKKQREKWPWKECLRC